ncbi:hypothetical protein AB4Z50_27910 [Paenibacillus sp. 2TAB26]
MSLLLSAVWYSHVYSSNELLQHFVDDGLAGCAVRLFIAGKRSTKAISVMRIWRKNIRSARLSL